MYLFIGLLLASMALKTQQFILSDCGDTLRRPGRPILILIYININITYYLSCIIWCRSGLHTEEHMLYITIDSFT